MKNAALIREIWRDIYSGTAWTFIFTLVASTILTGIAAFDVLLVSRLNNQAHHFRHSMASIMVLESAGHIDPESCLALARLEGVHSALAIRKADRQLSASVLPSSHMRTYEANGNIQRMLRISPTDLASTEHTGGNGVYLSVEAAKSIAALPGEQVSFTNGRAVILGVFPWSEDDGRRPGFAYSVFTPVAPVGHFDECWVDVWPMNPALDPLIRSAALPTTDSENPTRLAPLNSSFGASFDGISLFDSRLSALGPWAVAAGGTLIGWISVWRRRLEISSDLHAGVRRADLMVKFGWKTAAWLLLTTGFSLPVLSWMILRNPLNDQSAMWVLSLHYVIIMVCASFLGSFLATLMVKEKHLLRFFKHR